MVQGGRRSSSVQLLITPVEAHWRLEEGLGAGGGEESLSSEGLGSQTTPQLSIFHTPHLYPGSWVPRDHLMCARSRYPRSIEQPSLKIKT